MATQTQTLPATLTPAHAGTLLPSLSLWWREIVRFYRQRARVVGVIASPLLFWIVIGSGFGTSFRSSGAGGQHYLAFFFPGALIMIVLFTAIFTMMSVIEDRKEGFLLSVLVAPVSRSVIVLGKVLGGATLATLQGLIFLVFAPAVGVHFTLASFGLTVVTIFLVSFSLTALGFIIAWPMDSTQAFHAIINLFLIPLWLLSGSLFPLSGASLWIRLLMRINPLTYGTEALRSLLFPGFVGDGLVAGRQPRGSGSVHADHVWPVIPRRQPAQHETGGIMQLSPTFFPTLDAVLNGSSAVLIGSGLYLHQDAAHPGAQAADDCRVRYLIALPGFLSVLPPGTARRRNALSRTRASRAPFYFTLLISHTILAAVVVPFILITLARALKGRFARHKAIAPYTFAIWMYVSVTGVIIYLMLYKIFAP